MFSHVGTKPSIIMESKMCTTSICNLNRMDYHSTIQGIVDRIDHELGIHHTSLTARMFTSWGIFMLSRGPW